MCESFKEPKCVRFFVPTERVGAKTSIQCLRDLDKLGKVPPPVCVEHNIRIFYLRLTWLILYVC